VVKGVQERINVKLRYIFSRICSSVFNLKTIFKEKYTTIMSSSTSNNILTLKTVQVGPFRTLMNALKDILTDTNVTFQADGMRICNVDKSQTIYVHLHLEASEFEFYECKKENIVIGVNVANFFKVINSIESSDTLTIYIENSEYNNGIVNWLSFKFENDGIKQCKTQKMKLIESEPDEIKIPDVEFSSVINLPSADFQKIIKDLNNIGETVTIVSTDKILKFSSTDGQISSEIIRYESNESMSFSKKQDSSEIIQGVFSLKSLVCLVKCTNLCNKIELFLKNDLPLVVQYKVATLGTIKICVSPQSQ